MKKHISTSDGNVIYYTSECSVWALNRWTAKKRLLASLECLPTCLDARYGWVCVGALDEGHCTFINVNAEANDVTDRRQHNYSESEVDALLPLDLDPESRLLATISGQSGARPIPQHSSLAGLATTQSAEARGDIRRKPIVHRVQCGDDIVNSVTIYRLRTTRKDCQDEDVVVVTNNDKTVRIFSLSQMRSLNTIEFGCAMNHASISPSGEMMMAVGDEPRVFFCKRSQLSSITTCNEGSYTNYEWEQIAEPEMSLAHQKHFLGDLADELQERVDTCFATAFSPSGHLCAAASQTGIITVFDTSLIRPNLDTLEAVVDIFKTSRPVAMTNFSGAVRSMCFSPAPWDLLAWAEDRGRVCVVDVRPGPFRLKQILKLDIGSPDLNYIHVAEQGNEELAFEERQIGLEARFIMRQREALEAQDRLAAVSDASDYIELAAERRRILQEASPDSLRPSNESFHAFTEAEERMLEEIRQYRRRENAQLRNESSEPSASPYSINYPGLSQRVQEAVPRATDRVPELRFRSSTPGVGSSLNSISRSTDSIRDWINHRSALEQSRGSNRREPRRRSSVVISNSNDPSRTTASHPSSLAPIGTAAPNFSTSPSRLMTSTLPSPPPEPTPFETRHDAWDIISNAMTSNNRVASRDPSRNNPSQELTTSISTDRPNSQYDAETNTMTLDQTYASARANVEDHVAQTAAADRSSPTDRSLAALHAQQARSLQQLRDQQTELASYRARYEHLRSVNAADMRRLEQTYLERSATRRGEDATAVDTLDDEQLSLVRRITMPHLGRSGGGNGIGRSTAVAPTGATVGGTVPATSNARLTRRINVHDLRGEESDGVVTMGLGWSPDGGRLYVGTEEGILAYEVNLRWRMQFPAEEWL